MNIELIFGVLIGLFIASTMFAAGVNFATEDGMRLRLRRHDPKDGGRYVLRLRPKVERDTDGRADGIGVNVTAVQTNVDFDFVVKFVPYGEDFEERLATATAEGEATIAAINAQRERAKELAP